MSPAANAENQLNGFLTKYTPEIAALARDVLDKMRKAFPGAVELVYDNYNALVIGLGPTENSSECIFSIALYPRWVTLFFLPGAGLPDPEKRLKGTGKQVRYIALESAKTLEEPAVKTLLAHALQRAAVRFDKKTQRRMIIKSVSAKQRPRRPSTVPVSKQR